MAIISSDTFTDLLATFLESHTPDIGTGWTVLNANDMTCLFPANNLQFALGARVGTAREGTSIGSDQMDVSIDGQINIDNSGHHVGVAGRYSNADHNNQYRAYIKGNNATTCIAVLEKNIANVVTSLGTFTQTYAVNNADIITIKLQVRTVKDVFLNGVDRITSADDNLTGINFAGVYGRNTSPIGDNYLSQSVAVTPAGMPAASSTSKRRRMFGVGF